MSAIEKAAKELHAILWNNVGENDDWPIQITCDDALANRFCQAINALHQAILEKEHQANEDSQV
jgi:hypothetical protein